VSTGEVVIEVLLLLVLLSFIFIGIILPLANKQDQLTTWLNSQSEGSVMGYPGEAPEYSQSPGFYESGGPSPSGIGNIETNNDLDALQPEFRKQADIVISRGQSECDVDLYAAETLRTYERSDYLYGIGRDYCRKSGNPTAPLMVNGKKDCFTVTNAQAGESYHNFGLAIDLYPMKSGSPEIEFDKDKKLMKKMECVAKIAANIGIKWGGDFKSFKDYPHFQRMGVDLAQLRQEYPGGWQV